MCKQSEQIVITYFLSNAEEEMGFLGGDFVGAAAGLGGGGVLEGFCPRRGFPREFFLPESSILWPPEEDRRFREKHTNELTHM